MKRRCFPRPTYWFPEEQTIVCFVPCQGVPGYSHRVMIDHHPVDWLSSDAKPNGKSAEYFERKHATATAERNNEGSAQ